MTLRAVLKALTVVHFVGAASPNALAAYDGTLVDVHIHYSHDAWDRLPPAEAIALLREAGLERAFVSSSSDEGTQKLHAVAPELVVPVLRPYRARGETATWMHDASVGDLLAGLIARNRYAGIGEFHVFGADADLPLLRRVVRLAVEHDLFLHAHADAEAIERIFAQDPEALVLWAHSGFEAPAVIAAMLEKYPTLWADLAFRSEHDQGDAVHPEWRALFEAHPTRFMLGTDTYVPERWHFVRVHAAANRRWLAALPPALAARIASGNALDLLARTGFATSPRSGCDRRARHEIVLGADGLRALVRFAPEAPGVGEHFVAHVRVCDDAGHPLDAAVSMDATMPAHGHGMNYTPRVERIAPGEVRVTGLMFHMPGDWQIVVTVADDGRKQRLTHDYTMGY